MSEPLDMASLAQGGIACRRIGAGRTSAGNGGIEILLVGDFPTERINIVGRALAQDEPMDAIIQPQGESSVVVCGGRRQAQHVSAETAPTRQIANLKDQIG
jgi:hypothetical protein